MACSRSTAILTIKSNYLQKEALKKRVFDCDLPFPHLEVPGVNVPTLEGGEEQLDGSSSITVRPSEEHRDPQALHQLQRALAGCVWGIVVQDDCVLSPVSIFAVKLEHQLPQEDLHHPIVGVGLYQ